MAGIFVSTTHPTPPTHLNPAPCLNVCHIAMWQTFRQGSCESVFPICQQRVKHACVCAKWACRGEFFHILVPRYQILASWKAWEMSASVGVCKEAKTKANVGSISFHETRQHVSFLIAQEEGEVHQIVPFYYCSPIKSSGCHVIERQARPLLQSLHSGGNHLVASQNLAGHHLGEAQAWSRAVLADLTFHNVS